MLGVLLLPVQRLSFVPLRWAASLLGLRSVPRPIILSCHWTSLRLGSFKVLSQAHDRLDLFPFLNLVQRYYFFLTCANFFHFFFKKKWIFRKMDNLFSQIYNKTPRAITARGAQFTINPIQIRKSYAKVRLLFDICKSFVQFVPFWNMLLQRLQGSRAPSV